MRVCLCNFIKRHGVGAWRNACSFDISVAEVETARKNGVPDGSEKPLDATIGNPFSVLTMAQSS
jgi:hypothetical protein